MMLSKRISDVSFKKWPEPKKQNYLNDLAFEIQKSDYNNDSRHALDLIGDYQSKVKWLKGKPGKFSEEILPMIYRNITEKLNRVDQKAETEQAREDQKNQKIRRNVFLRSKALKVFSAVLILAAGGKSSYEIYRSYQQKKMVEQKTLEEQKKSQLQREKEAKDRALEEQRKAEKREAEAEAAARARKARMKKKVRLEPQPVPVAKPKKARPPRANYKDTTDKTFERVQ